jgi:outer membrane lipoprotein-sorting protein
MTMRAAGTGIFICGILLTAGIRAQENLPPAEIHAALHQLAATRPSGGVLVEFKETRKLPLLDEPVVTTGTIEFLPPHFFRKSVQGEFPSTTIGNGRDLWIYFPKEAEAEKYSLKRNRALHDSLEALAAGFDPSQIAGRFRIHASRKDDRLELKLAPRQRALRSSLSAMNLRFGPDGKLERIMLREPGGGSSIIRILTEKSAALSPADFQFVPPPGTSVSQPLG